MDASSGKDVEGLSYLSFAHGHWPRSATTKARGKRPFSPQEIVSMPTLPSGKRLWLSMEAILAPGSTFYPAPRDHFWYREIDVTSGWLPLPGASAPPEHWQKAPVPNGRIDAARYVRVLLGEAGSETREWHGDWLVAYRRPEGFTDEDWTACMDFFGSDQALHFLDQVIERCSNQADMLKPLDVTGFAPVLGSDPALAPRLACAAEAVEELDDLLQMAYAMENQFAAQEICDRISQIQLFVEESMGSFGPHRGLAHRVAAACAASLGEHAEAARHGRVAAELIPEDRLFSNQLALRLRREGYPDEARILSRTMIQNRAGKSLN